MTSHGKPDCRNLEIAGLISAIGPSFKPASAFSCPQEYKELIYPLFVLFMKAEERGIFALPVAAANLKEEAHGQPD
ncbi:hypothetical protein AGR13a_Lc90128 [Agrobacterium genomosp. 13 str. CFBP 6927]|uniref:Uncharacterized protein n=1 Tax=Agrobacterium genomosp. 13 str. CFBP 6927 TaxID=1183428 RepID=A0ABM9VMZ5_9HYPH|nr:hypothetical protein AGR13a_Lc90128 [Agrobacterium genomosp. 13 str. CFBP 6927]